MVRIFLIIIGIILILKILDYFLSENFSKSDLLKKIKKIKKIIIFILIISIVFFLFIKINNIYYEKNFSPLAVMRKYMNFDIEKCNLIDEKTTGASFFGDGEKMYSYDCTDIHDLIESHLSTWKKLPLPSDLNRIIYGGIAKDGKKHQSLFQNITIPKVTNGIYYFLERSNEKTNIQNEIEPSFEYFIQNFSLAIYDFEEKKLYYIEYNS